MAARAVALGLALASCAAHVVFPPPLVVDTRTSSATAGAEALPAGDTAALARARAYEAATGNFSALVRIDVRDVAHDAAFSGRGAIAVDRAQGAMRMQVTGPGGVTAVDLLARDGRYWLTLLGRAPERGALDAPPGRGFPAGPLARAFLGFDWAHARAESTEQGAALAVARVDTAAGHALLTFEARDGTTREVRWFTGAAERSRVRFGEFTPEGEVRFPRVVLYWQHDPDVSATVTVERRTIAPVLPPATFAPRDSG